MSIVLLELIKLLSSVNLLEVSERITTLQDVDDQFLEDLRAVVSIDKTIFAQVSRLYS